MAVKAVRKVTMSAICSASTWGLCIAVSIATTGVLADETAAMVPRISESEIEKFCTDRAISDRGVRIALAHLWNVSAEGQEHYAAPMKPTGDSESLPQLPITAMQAFWEGWRFRICVEDLRLTPWSLERPSSTGITPLYHGTAFHAGERQARILINAALTESRTLERSLEGAKIHPREFRAQLHHYQAILLLRHIIEQKGDKGEASDSGHESKPADVSHDG